MELANRFYESGYFQSAEPDLMLDDRINCSNDTYFDEQWGLKNTLNNGVDISICDAWQISTGSNVKVAVLDQGIDLTHPDLAGNIHSLSYDCENGTSPQVVRGEHGTACAGIIGAVKNTTGVVGVAPNCKLMSISNSFGVNTLSRITRANGINWAWKNGADVISNSWASAVQFEVIDNAIDSAVVRGRNGLGCVVVFSSGNKNTSVSYPAYLSNVLAVGAIDRCGKRAGRIDIIPNSCDPWPDNSQPGSSYGTDLDVVAPKPPIQY